MWIENGRLSWALILFYVMQCYQLAEDLGQAFSERSILESCLRAEQNATGSTKVESFTKL